MAKGLVKAKEYDWQDSNLALFGTDVEKNIKKESAATEKAWKGAGQRVGRQIWRIKNFKVETLSRSDYGKFFNGDSYIILNTYMEKDNDALLYDVHFWIGSHSTQDEYGTAAYKTVELDTFLDDRPVQHREVMGNESNLFKSYFPSLQIMEGGAKSGFRHVLPREYKRRLLRIRGTTITNCVVQEVPFVRNSLDTADVFILDLGLKLYQWNGEGADKDEMFRAGQVTREIKSERGKAVVEVYDERDTPQSFYQFFPQKAPEKTEQATDANSFEKVLIKLSDARGTIKLSTVSKGNVSYKDFNSNDVFILDTGHDVFVWHGCNASKNEKKNAMSHAHNYLKGTGHKCAAVTVLSEGDHSNDFAEALD